MSWSKENSTAPPEIHSPTNSEPDMNLFGSPRTMDDTCTYTISENTDVLKPMVPAHCSVCCKPILGRFVLKVSDKTYHSRCLKCHTCDQTLSQSCFVRGNQLYCAKDFFRKYGYKCSGCKEGISPTEIVRRAQSHVFHIRCFTCSTCSRKFATGDEYYLVDNRKLICKKDFDSYSSDGRDSVNSDSENGNKRPRTTITSSQLEALKSAYNKTAKPSRNVREKLSNDTGLDMRVVQVWFQNRRAKEKRLKKDAGRHRPAWEHSRGSLDRGRFMSRIETAFNPNYNNNNIDRTGLCNPISIDGSRSHNVHLSNTPCWTACEEAFSQPDSFLTEATQTECTGSEHAFVDGTEFGPNGPIAELSPTSGIHLYGDSIQQICQQPTVNGNLDGVLSLNVACDIIGRPINLASPLQISNEVYHLANA